MTPESLIAHVDESIEKALRGESWIDEEILSIRGFATGTMRRLFSNLCHLPKASPVYCEVGLYCGATFCSAINNNPTLRAIGFEDFSQSFGATEIREQLIKNIELFAKWTQEFRTADVSWFDIDFFSYPKELLPKVDVFYYDGSHDQESTAKALPALFDMLTGTFIFIVDDFHWDSVSKGTQAGFDALAGRVKIEKQWILSGNKATDDEIFHNGLAIFLCDKLSEEDE